MWKVGGLAVVMVAVVIWLFGCSRESIEEGMEEGTLSAPMILLTSSVSAFNTSTIIDVYDAGGTLIGVYEIELAYPEPDPNPPYDIPPSDTWCYKVTELSGKALSHWVLAVECLVTPENHIIGSSPPGTIGQDGSTGYWGVKWDAPFPGNTFCIILDDEYGAAMVRVVVKTGGGHGVGYLAGPDCLPIVHNGVEQGVGGMP
jgi:hypothetical protein